MEMTSLKHLFIEELKDIYNAEGQLIKALPKMAKAATSPELRGAFEEHLEETRGQIERLEEVFQLLEMKPKGKKCKAMEGLLAEGSEMIKEDADDDVKDAGLISAAQRVEHYEIAAYGSVRTYARLLGNQAAADLLQQTLDEEGDCDKRLTELAESINVEAMEEEGEQQEEEEVDDLTSAGKSSGRGRGNGKAKRTTRQR